ncbi:MAG: phosphoribosylformylglycinamidine synthase, partial [Clostridia bacterium]|nr:phosphoribosylformylglycinamidine synthase [Clostridia bacterium]
IVKCNDFGAGGVSVAIGELADSLDISLDQVPKKYEGLTGTELAISESQERMAVVLAKETVSKFIEYAKEENLNATIVATVTDNGRMRMMFNGKTIVDLKRSFLDTNGVKQMQEVVIDDNTSDYMDKVNDNVKELVEAGEYANALLKELSRPNVCSTKGLGEMFDSTIGAASVLMPFGGKNQLTPAIVMAAKPPTGGKTDTTTVSSFACSPYLMENSPFTGAIYSIVASISKLIASGVKKSTIRLTLQEFFKKLGKDANRWGEPTSALLGALYAQLGTGCGAIGGKDSMSGTFEKIDVPPTLISFAVGITKASKIIHNTFKYFEGNKVYLVKLPVDKNFIPDFDKLNNLYDSMYNAIDCGDIKYATVVDEGGAICALAKSCVGNKVGFDIEKADSDLFKPYFGSFI